MSVKYDGTCNECLFVYESQTGLRCKLDVDEIPEKQELLDKYDLHAVEEDTPCHCPDLRAAALADQLGDVVVVERGDLEAVMECANYGDDAWGVTYKDKYIPICRVCPLCGVPVSDDKQIGLGYTHAETCPWNRLRKALEGEGT